MSKPTHEDIKKIVSLITKKPVREISDKAELRGELGMDSLAALDMLVTIEEKFGVVVEQDKAAAFVTLQDVFNYLDQI